MNNDEEEEPGPRRRPRSLRDNGRWPVFADRCEDNRGRDARVLKEDVGDCFPDWSPKGDWISYCDKNGSWNLISPDGKMSKALIKSNTKTLAFAKDGKLLYGIETGTGAADQNGATLFSLDPATLKRKVIKELGKELRPTSRFSRFSLAPDGKSIAYGVEKDKEDLWMLKAIDSPASGTRSRTPSTLAP